MRSGFDEFFGIMSGAGDLFSHQDMMGDPDLFEGEVPVERAGYITDLLTNRAAAYLRRRGFFERKFFWRTRRGNAVRRGKWKYVREGEVEYLFDPLRDGHEQANYKNSEPSSFARLRSEMDHWNAGVLGYPKS